MIQSLYGSAHEGISLLVDHILTENDEAEVFALISGLCIEVTNYFFEKYNCQNAHYADTKACRQHLQVEVAGLKRIQEANAGEMSVSEKKEIVKTWFQDSFWMVEVNCQRCSFMSQYPIILVEDEASGEGQS